MNVEIVGRRITKTIDASAAWNIMRYSGTNLKLSYKKFAPKFADRIDFNNASSENELKLRSDVKYFSNNDIF